MQQRARFKVGRMTAPKSILSSQQRSYILALDESDNSILLAGPSGVPTRRDMEVILRLRTLAQEERIEFFEALMHLLCPYWEVRHPPQEMKETYERYMKWKFCDDEHQTWFSECNLQQRLSDYPASSLTWIGKISL